MVEIKVTGLNCSADSATKNRPLPESSYSFDLGGTERNSLDSIGRMAAKTRLSSGTRLIIGQYGWRGLRLLVEDCETRKSTLAEPKRLAKHESVEVIIFNSSSERVCA